MADERVARTRRVRQRWLTAAAVLAAATAYFLPLHTPWHLDASGPSQSSPLTTICLVVSAAGTLLAGTGAIISSLAARSAAQAAARTPPGQAPAAPPAQDPGDRPGYL